MTEDTSLSAFVRSESDGVSPAETTFSWRPDGSPCDTCGQRAERRWHQSGSLVCADCKSWGKR